MGMIDPVVAIAGPHLSRRGELLALVVTALAALVTAVVPALYAVLLPVACAAMAAAAPQGRRVASAAVIWFPVSFAVVLGTTLV